MANVTPILDGERGEPNIQHQHDGIVRTAMNCHACSHAFLALIDHSVDAVLQIHCPYCGHKHGRQITAGVMTEVREGPGDAIDTFQAKVKVWKVDPAARPELAGRVATSTTSEFLRHRWLNLMNRT
jgi:DNA-directed RNA polymerase subunit RPC12/RpoP